MLTGPTKSIWNRALSKKIRRLTQSNDFDVVFNDCIEFIHYNQVPSGHKVTYANFVCDHCPTNSEPWRVRLAVGGDRVEYFADAGSSTTTI